MVNLHAIPIPTYIPIHTVSAFLYNRVEMEMGKKLAWRISYNPLFLADLISTHFAIFPRWSYSHGGNGEIAWKSWEYVSYNVS